MSARTAFCRLARRVPAADRDRACRGAAAAHSPWRGHKASGQRRECDHVLKMTLTWEQALSTLRITATAITILTEKAG
jgi:hypothetical protein